MKSQEQNMYNVILFERLGKNKSKIISYGIGYKDSPEMKKLMKFFVSANETTMKKLIDCFIVLGEGASRLLAHKTNSQSEYEPVQFCGFGSFNAIENVLAHGCIPVLAGRLLNVAY